MGTSMDRSRVRSTFLIRKRFSTKNAIPRLELLEDRRLLTATFQFSSSVYQVANTQKAIAITVTLESSPGDEQDSFATVDYSATPSSIAQPRLRPGTDFVPTSGTLGFESGTSSMTFTITILDGSQSSSFINPVYYVDLVLSNPTDEVVLGTPSQALLKITTTSPSQLTLTPLPLKAAQNQALTTEIAEVQDAVPNLQASSYNAVVSWGDGTPAQTVPLQPQGTFFTVNGTHTFTQEGTFTYTITVTPANGPAATTTGVVVVGGFVTGLYHDLFDRAPDAAGLQFWDAAIAAGESRQQVALFFWNCARASSNHSRAILPILPGPFGRSRRPNLLDQRADQRRQWCAGCHGVFHNARVSGPASDQQSLSVGRLPGCGRFGARGQQRPVR